MNKEKIYCDKNADKNISSSKTNSLYILQAFKKMNLLIIINSIKNFFKIKILHEFTVLKNN